MLNDEEMEALRNFKSEYETCDHYSSDLIIELDDAEIILNLIEKQSKEIEELKQDRDEYKEEYIKLQNARYYNYISKDKIKSEIEELKNMKVDGEVFITSVNFAIKVLQSLLEKE